jgi:hypothetical protein
VLGAGSIRAARALFELALRLSGVVVVLMTISRCSVRKFQGRLGTPIQ